MRIRLISKTPTKILWKNEQNMRKQ